MAEELHRGRIRAGARSLPPAPWGGITRDAPGPPTRPGQNNTSGNTRVLSRHWEADGKAMGVWHPRDIAENRPVRAGPTRSGQEYV
jgi:hypothetical protein